VTLCIAAECEHDGVAAIVLCCDWRGQRGSEYQELVGSDDVEKIRDIPGVQAQALLAGSETDADRLLTCCESAIRKFCATPVNSDSDIVITTLLREIEQAAEIRKAQIIEHHVRMSSGIDYLVFRNTPKDRMTSYDEEVYRGIQSLTLGADIIIATFSDEPVILRLDRYGVVHWQTNYAVIGASSDIAYALLCQQPWDLGGSSDPPNFGISKPMTLMQCLYRVYEAKKAAESNRTVGGSTAIVVMLQGKGEFEISEQCRDKLKEVFERKNRRVPQIDFDPTFLETSDAEELQKEAPRGIYMGRRRTQDSAYKLPPEKSKGVGE
jgi:hypothetical protein